MATAKKAPAKKTAAKKTTAKKTAAKKAPAKKTTAKKAPAKKTAAKKTTAKKAPAKKAPAKKASARARVENSVTEYLNNLLDSSRKAVDDLLDSASSIEKSARKSVGEAAERVLPSDADIKALRKRVKDLANQVEKLAKARAKGKK